MATVETLALKLTLLDERISRVESLLMISRAQPHPGEPEWLTPDEQSQTGQSATATRPVSFEEPQPVEPITPTKSSHAVPPPLPPRVLPVSTLSYRPAVKPSPIAEGHLERTIGLRWAGWIGAIVLVIGAGLGVRFVYDQHWFNAVPPQVWLGIIFAAGLALIGTGELVLRKVHAVPAASLFGAGVSTLFLAGYVGHSYYNLYSPSMALVLMAVAAVLGALVAMRGNLVSIAVLALIGGDVAPMLVGDPHSPREALLIYLLALQLVALFLAWWGSGRKWWTLRVLSLATTSLWITALASEAEARRSLLMTFSLLFAALFHLELLVSAGRLRARGAFTVGGKDGGGFAVLVTAALTAAVLWASADTTAPARGMLVLGMAAASVALGWTLRCTRRRSFIELGVSHCIAALGLLAIAVPTALDGAAIDIGWAILAVILAVTGSAVNSRLARWSAVAFWTLAVIHVAIDGAFGVPLVGGELKRYTVLGESIAYPTLLALAFALCGQAIAWLTNIKNPTSVSLRKLAVTISLIATLLWTASCIFTLSATAATLLITAYAWGLVAMMWAGIDLELSTQAGVLFGLASAKWMFCDELADRLSPNWDPLRYAPVVNPPTAIGSLLAGSIATLGYLAKDFKRRQPAVAAAWVLLVWAGTFEIERCVELIHSHGDLVWPIWQAKVLAWTIGWTTALAAAYAWLRWCRSGSTEIVQTLLPRAICAMALMYLTLDTTVWRILDRPASVPIPANLESATAAIVLAALLGLILFATDARQPRSGSLPLFLSAMVGLWAITIEIDRHFSAGAFVSHAEQVSLSIAWSIYAVASVAMGFRLRAANLRYCGLALFAVTLVKVVLVDMNQVQTGFRILSFMGLGALLLGTSVLYGKLGSKLLPPPS